MGRKEQTLLIAMGANVLLIGTKFLLASASGSLALKASAWHSFADLFVSAIVLGGLVVAAGRPGGGGAPAPPGGGADMSTTWPTWGGWRWGPWSPSASLTSWAATRPTWGKRPAPPAWSP